MPRYLSRFRVETCLKYNNDLTIPFREAQPTFLFSKQAQEDANVIAQLELQAENYEGAWSRAAGSLLPPILDALSFATGAPLLLRDLELALKDETGKQERRALYVGHRRVPALVQLGDMDIKETEKILAAGEELRLPLCWHCYALERDLAHERFFSTG